MKKLLVLCLLLSHQVVIAKGTLPYRVVQILQSNHFERALVYKYRLHLLASPDDFELRGHLIEHPEDVLKIVEEARTVVRDAHGNGVADLFDKHVNTYIMVQNAYGDIDKRTSELIDMDKIVKLSDRELIKYREKIRSQATQEIIDEAKQSKAGESP